MLVAGAVVLGGVAFLAIRPRQDAATILRRVAIAAGVVVVAQLAIAALTLGALAQDFGVTVAWPYARTPFAMIAAARVALGVVVAALALTLARAPRGRGPWIALAGGSFLLVASSAFISHAVARLDYRPALIALDAVHQAAAAVWVGGLLHLIASRERDGAVLGRFSSMALGSVVVLVAAGVALSVAYVGDAGALVETAYGVMVLTKAVLLTVILAVAAVNFRTVRSAVDGAGVMRLRHLVEIEAGLAVTVLFAAASLTSLPPAVDVTADRASLSEVVARFTAIPPRLASPAIGDLLRETNPLGGALEQRLAIEREWSEFNHHWAGLFVLAMGVAALACLGGVRVMRHWPLLLVGLAAFLFVRNDPEVWPLGPIGFFESLREPEILQHRIFMLLVAVFGVFEWMVRTTRIAPRPWGYMFPLVCAVGGGLLLTHSHTVFSVKEAFLMEVTHAPIGVLGACAGWARWLELRWPDAGAWPARTWPACLILVGALLLFYSE
jgi:putative copper resistance protein D